MSERADTARAGLSVSLIRRLRAGDMSAGESLQELYSRDLCRFALRYLGNDHDAEDAVQEVFVKILESDTSPNEFRRWAYRIVRNVCLNRLRSKGRRRDADRLETGLDIPMEQVGELTRLVRVEDGVAIRTALETLSDAQREVLILRYLEGLERDEIAEVLDVSVSVVKSRLFEGINRLRK